VSREAALIMAGGEGTRMARTRPHVPKTLVELAGYPLIVLMMRRLRAVGIADIWVSVHHRAQEIIHHLRGRADLRGLSIEFIVEEEPLGTIGALAEMRLLDRPVLVQNGDLLSGIDLDALRACHSQRCADLTIATHLEFHRLKLGEVVTNGDGEVIEYREKPVKEFKISSGTYLVSPAALRHCRACVFTPFPEFVEHALRAGCRVIEMHHDAPWIDINDDADLTRAQRMFEQDPMAFGVHPRELDGRTA
jgi:NDP-sugar pyrophosphorylase family protein